MKYRLIMAGIIFLGSCATPDSFLQEIQVTHDTSRNHDLDNNDNFSPDGKWLVYDTRTISGGIGACSSIERVNIETIVAEVLFEIPDNHEYGPGAGAASYHPIENKIIFIHGLPLCTEKNPYQQWRRTGVMVNDNQPNVPVNMDSRDVSFPYTPGALRGGTHRHEWSRDGKWIGYTYNDAIMKKLEDSTGIKWNLRTIAVSNQQHPVVVDKDEAGENVAGTWYSAVVVRVVPDPKPGSDEISNAASDSWIGTGGYKKPDGTLQVARAFIGKVTGKDGKAVEELFVVDIPDSINIPGEFGPLEGTRNTFPMPPKGTVQKRLTFTANTKYPGCSGVVRSSPDGSQIGFLARDKNGIQQIFLISPLGGVPVQITEHDSDVQSAPRWSPENNSIVYIWDNSIVFCEISDRPFENRCKRLTSRTDEAPSNLVWSNDGKTIAFNRLVPVEGKNDQIKQIFVIKLSSND
ncbi:MAG: DUF3748 domain-containing protein [Bacteroidia bacterium]|nr:DUF3748 domain-containing protein [Bacteroidia bacterium]